MPLEYLAVIITLILGIVTIWIAQAISSNRINSTQQLAIQILNNQAPLLRQIYDDSRGTNNTVNNTHQRVGEMQTIQACQGQEMEAMTKRIESLLSK